MITRSKGKGELVQQDPEIEKTLRILRIVNKRRQGLPVLIADSLPPMAEPNPTIRDIITQGVTAVPSCIQEPAIPDGQRFELKSSVLHHLPIFHGLSNEDPNRHLKDFQFICNSMKPNNASIEVFRDESFSILTSRQGERLVVRASKWTPNIVGADCEGVPG